MMLVEPLMLEHRLIERMIRIMNKGLARIKQEKKVDLVFVDTVVDFIRTYADRCHHGKEEDILFRDLSKKPLSLEHKKMMGTLIKEHVLGRNNVKKLITARDDYARGNGGALDDIISNMEILAKFYPKHIEKEDKHFFIPCMDYFMEEERNNMLQEFWGFDKRLIHEKYKSIVERYEYRKEK